MSDDCDYIFVVADDTNPALKAALAKIDNVVVYDPDRVVVDDPSAQTFKADKAEITTVTSAIYYLDDEGKKKKMYLILPEQQTFGVHYKFPLGSEGEAKDAKDGDKKKVDPSKAVGFQLDYPLQALGPVDPKTNALAVSSHEKAVMDMLDSHRSLVVQKIRSEVKEHEDDPSGSAIPPAIFNSFAFSVANSEKKKNPKLLDGMVKPGYAWPNNKDDKTKVDKSKPARMYLDLFSSGKKDKLVCKTTFYNLDDDEDQGTVASAFVDQSGKILPVVWVKQVYWGSHGQKSYGASVKYVIVQGFFRVGGGSSAVVTKRLIGGRSGSTTNSSGAAAAAAAPSKSAAPGEDAFGSDDDDGDKSPLDVVNEVVASSKKDKKSKNSKKDKKSKKRE